jgi:Cd2+/Zn2+-exporting ATPase
MLALADAPRGTAFDAVAELQGRVTGVDVVMLTGDRAAPAEATARALGLRGGCFAELLPAEKLARLEALKLSAGGGVGMVGDGINDAPALAASDVGIAMGSGLALAADSADVVLLSDNLRAIPAAIAAARACRTVVRTNIAIAAAVKLTMVALVLGWRGTQLWMGVVSDVGALLLVTLNGTRLLGAKVVISPNVNVSADVEAGGEVAAAREKSPLLSSATVTPDFNTF